MSKKVLGLAALGSGLLISLAALLLFAAAPPPEDSRTALLLLGSCQPGTLFLLLLGTAVMISGIIFLLRSHFEP